MKEPEQVKARPTKYVLKYERSLKEIAEIFGVTRATIYNWVKNDKKRAWMEEVLKNL
jgi:transposase